MIIVYDLGSLRTRRARLHLCGRIRPRPRLLELLIQSIKQVCLSRPVPLHDLLPFGAVAQVLDEVRVLLRVALEDVAAMGIAAPQGPAGRRRWLLRLDNVLDEVGIAVSLRAEVHHPTVAHGLRLGVEPRQRPQSPDLVLESCMRQERIAPSPAPLIFSTRRRQAGRPPL